jgi:hypothetical protein
MNKHFKKYVNNNKRTMETSAHSKNGARPAKPKEQEQNI